MMMKELLQNSEQAEQTPSRRNGKQKNRFNVKYDKDQRVDVILNFELDPSIAYRFDTAFVCLLLDRIGF